MDASKEISKESRLWRLIDGVIHSAPIVLVIVALGAGPLGVDSDEKWGPFRVGLLILGLAGLAVLVGSKAVDALDRRLARGYQAPPPKRSVTSRTYRLAALRKPGAWIALGLLFIAIELTYVFLVSVGLWTEWPRTTQYYDALAQSFIHGEVALPIEPSPLLANLDDPYDPIERQDIPILYDASFYHGKYYLYWGPAPAVATAVWKLITNTSVGDEHIVFIAVNTISVFSVLIVFHLKRKYYPTMPAWLQFASILIVTTSHPLLWVLNSPSIYPAAIASGQALLVAGLYFAIPVIDGVHGRVWRFALIGILWSLALASRLTLTGAVGVLSISIVLRLVSQCRSKGAFVRTTAFVLPLLIGFSLMGLYNHARFGSIFETGFRYQVGKLNEGLKVDEGSFFDAGYLLPNAVYYLIAPLRFRSSFPFIRPLWEEWPALSALLERLQIPSAHHVESVTGLLFSMPTILFSGYLILDFIRRWLSPSPHTLRVSSSTGFIRNRQFGRTFGLILLAGLVAGTPTGLFYWVTNRFLLDSVPLLAITAAVGAWSIYDSGQMYPLRRAFVASLVWLVVIIALVEGFLLAMTGDWTRFDDLNPVAWKSLTEFFSR